MSKGPIFPRKDLDIQDVDPAQWDDLRIIPGTVLPFGFVSDPSPIAFKTVLEIAWDRRRS